jgi:hypothetical protein
MERLPEQIQVGMKVYDSELREIGKIDGLKYPENQTAPDVEPATLDAADDPNRHETIIDAVAEAVGREDVPEPCCATATSISMPQDCSPVTATSCPSRSRA